jgi:hypothetical protein
MKKKSNAWFSQRKLGIVLLCMTQANRLEGRNKGAMPTSEERTKGIS